LTSILNYGLRNANDKISHIGLEVGAPVFFREKEDRAEISCGL
jgi:hypothetical protein